jgi:hypothetical protein
MKRFTMHVPRARDSCTSYATENTDYLTVCGLTIIAILRTILNDYDYFMDKNPVIVKTPACRFIPNKHLCFDKYKDSMIKSAELFCRIVQAFYYQNMR